MGAPREYFYHLDARGRLSHDGTELVDARFLDVFFRRLRRDPDARHPGHPWLSICQGERCYLAADARPIVFTRFDGAALGYAATLAVPFEPAALRYCPEGRLYHPAPVGDLGLLGPAPTLRLGQDVEASGISYRLRVGDAWLTLLPLDKDS
ncbi:MAG: DUF4505 family protein [Planctomycetota bacterium]